MAKDILKIQAYGAVRTKILYSFIKLFTGVSNYTLVLVVFWNSWSLGFYILCAHSYKSTSINCSKIVPVHAHTDISLLIHSFTSNINVSCLQCNFLVCKPPTKSNTKLSQHICAFFCKKKSVYNIVWFVQYINLIQDVCDQNNKNTSDDQYDNNGYYCPPNTFLYVQKSHLQADTNQKIINNQPRRFNIGGGTDSIM